MSDSPRVTVLLADEDSLRRDGLALVLRENQEIDVVAGYADGQTALEKIRELRPDVAVVDLNLPVLHGIELIRRVRSEALGTKIIVLSGTSSEEIVREVVRAGADGHLAEERAGEASDRRDQLRSRWRPVFFAATGIAMGGTGVFLSGRTGARKPADDAAVREAEDGAHSGTHSGAPFSTGGTGSRQERPRGRTLDRNRFRERIRQEAGDLRDRDYDIMSRDGGWHPPGFWTVSTKSKAALVKSEEGAEPVPADPRGWLSDQLVDTSSGARSAAGRAGSRSSTHDVEARLPRQLIEEAVTKRFQSMAGKVQEQIAEQPVRTRAALVTNIQVKLVQRVSVLEQNMQHQAEAMHQLREYSQRTEDNLSRLISGVDKLANELPKRLAAAQTEPLELPARALRESTPVKEIRAIRSSGTAKKRIWRVGSSG